MPQIENIALFDMDGTLCDYETKLLQDLKSLASPTEQPIMLPIKDDAPSHLRARADLIRSNSDWWASLPTFQLGLDLWNLTANLGFRHVILTQGPRRNPSAWMGKKIWIDKNLGNDIDVIITRDKSLVYGKVLVDDWPEYIERWLKWRPRGLAIMPASQHNAKYTHKQVVRYDGTEASYDLCEERLLAVRAK